MAGLDTPSSTSSENPEEHYYEDFVKKVKSQKFLSNPNYLEGQFPNLEKKINNLLSQIDVGSLKNKGDIYFRGGKNLTSEQKQFIQFFINYQENKKDKKGALEKAVNKMNGRINQEEKKKILELITNMANINTNLTNKNSFQKDNFLDSKQRLTDYISAQMVDLRKEIENNQEKNPSRMRDRKMSVEIIGGNILSLSSYGQKSTYDLSKNNFNITILGKYQLPYKIEISRNDKGEILYDSDENKKNIKNMIQMMNIIHSIIYYDIKGLGKLNIKDKQNPFYYNKRYLLHGLDINTTPGIFLNNSYINDIKSIKGGTLVKFKDNINIDNLVDILNIIYRTENDIGN